MIRAKIQAEFKMVLESSISQRAMWRMIKVVSPIVFVMWTQNAAQKNQAKRVAPVV
jgi:hypothetical protein